MQLNFYGKIQHFAGYIHPKLFRAMKLTVFFMILGCLQISAKSFSQSINLIGKNISLEKALTEIGEQSGYFFFYKYNEIKNAKPITLNLKAVSLERALQESFKDQPFTYAIDQKTIVVTKLAQKSTFNLPLEVKGKVVDEKGAPLVGASVVVKATKQGIITDATGSFTFKDIPSDAVLVVTYIGFNTQELNLAGRATLTITLRENSQMLDAVVAIGYGTQQKKDVTGSISSIGAKQIKDQPVVSLDQAMAGQMAGVQVTQATGAPGGGSSVRVRGAGSLSAGNEPLYVIDGFPVTNDYNQNNNPLNSINPADIENIQVLKDASATAIYGSRGSNGVVIITTKAGKTGSSKADFSVNTGVQQVEKTIDVLNAREYALYINEARNNAWVNSGVGRSATDPNTARLNNVMYLLPAALSNPDALGEGIDWQDEIFRSAVMSNYQLNFSGGNETTKYFLSGGFLDQDGVILNSDLKRYSFRINLESKLNKRLKVGGNFTPSFTSSNIVLAEGNWQGGGIIQSAILAPPHISVYNADGSYSKITGLGLGTSEVDNPVKVALENVFKQKNLRLLGTAFAEVSILDELNFKTLVGADIRSFREQTFSPSVINPNSVNATKVPVGTNATAETRNWLAEFTLNYNKRFGKHSINALAGYTVQQEEIDQNSISATNYPNDIIKTINAAGLISSATSLQEEWALLSYLARVNYSFADKYLVTATFRQDGSSRFGADNKWGSFPSVSLGWRLSEENFLKNVSWINDLRLKTSYGLSGNNFISNYAHIGLTGAENYVFGASGGTVNNGIRLINIPNSLLGWEKNRQLDLGFEASIFKGRFNLAFDYYNKKTSDLLLNVPVPTLTGYTTAFQNIGEVENKGFEFSGTSRNLTGNFKWTTDFNFSTNAVKVLALGQDGSPIISRQATSASSPTHITQIGSAPGSFYGYNAIGVYQNAADVANSAVIKNAAGVVESKPGQLKFQDVNGDGVITTADRTVLGSPFPDFTYGMTNSFSFKNIDFSFTLQGVQGFEVMNVARRYTGNFIGNYNTMVSTSNGWKSEQNPGDGKSPQIDRNFNLLPGSNLANNITSLFVEDGSFLRIRNITLGYNLPTRLIQKASLSNARLSFTVQNAFTFTKYEGYNPEVSAQGGSPLVPGVDAGGYPLARTFMFGLNFGF
ncbi:MAG: TonB-dependent receptor [Bacteroidia bacterium]